MNRVSFFMPGTVPNELHGFSTECGQMAVIGWQQRSALTRERWSKAGAVIISSELFFLQMVTCHFLSAVVPILSLHTNWKGHPEISFLLGIPFHRKDSCHFDLPLSFVPDFTLLPLPSPFHRGNCLLHPLASHGSPHCELSDQRTTIPTIDRPYLVFLLVVLGGPSFFFLFRFSSPSGAIPVPTHPLFSSTQRFFARTTT
jgi:hypothetical protein